MLFVLTVAELLTMTVVLVLLLTAIVMVRRYRRDHPNATPRVAWRTRRSAHDADSHRAGAGTGTGTAARRR